MGVYRNIKCGECKHSFTGGYVYDNGFMNTNLGIPYIECPKCGALNKTGFTAWSSFPVWKKIYHWISVLLRAIPFGVGIGFLAFGVIEKGLEITSGLNAVPYAISGYIVMLIIMIYSNHRDIREVEKRCAQKYWKVGEMKSKEELEMAKKAELYDQIHKKNERKN